MTTLRADRVFFYVILILVIALTLWLVKGFLGSVVLAATAAVIVYPLQQWFLRRTGNRKGIATALTLTISVLVIVIPILFGTWLFLHELIIVSDDVAAVLKSTEEQLQEHAADINQWLQTTPFGDTLALAAQQVIDSVRTFAADIGRISANWLVSTTASVVSIGLPVIIFVVVLGTFISNGERAIAILKALSPLDDDIDQLFLDRMRSITRSMMLSIVVVAVVQGIVTGILMAIAGSRHLIALTVLATLLAILPGGAAYIAVPVGIMQILSGNVWGGALVIIGTLTFVSALANQVRPRMVRKDVFLNRAFMLVCVFSGLAIFGALGVVYGPLIMILFTTVIEVYLGYFRPGEPSVTITAEEEKVAAQSSPLETAR
ncbi:MAG: AI-2E family transporter [Caldilineaceae bacterium]